MAMNGGRHPYGNRPRGGQGQRMNMNYMSAGMQPQPPRGVLIQPHHHQLAAAVPTQPMYIQQQQPPGVHYNTGPAFPYQPYANVAAQQQLLRQPYTGGGSHPYQPAGAQMLSMNTVTAAGANAGIPPAMMPDNSAMLATTQTHMAHFVPNQPNVLQHHHAIQPQAPAAAAKQSKAIKIVNPDTMKEVDTSNLKKTSPASSARSTPKPTSESEQVQQQFKQTVNRAAVDSKGNDVAKQPTATPNAIIRQPNQQEQNVAMVTVDPMDTKSLSHDTAQSSNIDISQLPSNSGVHQKEPDSTPVAGDSEVEQSTEVSSTSDSNMLLEQQLPRPTEMVEGHISSDSNTEVKDEVSSEPVDNTRVIQEVDEKLQQIKDVVQKPEAVTMETLKAEKEDGHDDHQAVEDVKQHVEKSDIEMSVDSVKLVTEDIDVECPNKLEHDDVVEIGEDTSSMEKSSMEKYDTEITSVEMLSTETSNITQSSMEEPDMEESDMEEASTQVHSVKKEAGIEDKCAGEDDTGEGSYVGDTGPSSLEVEDRPQVVSAVAMTADQLQCYEDISDGEFEVTDDDDVEKEVPAAGADNGTGDLPDEKADDLVDDEREEDEQEEDEQEEDEQEEDELEDGELHSEDDGQSKTYGRDFLLSLQFLEQCKQRPSNLMNAEYIRKELPRQSEMRFDPGYYDMPSGGRKKMSYHHQGSKKKIELNKEQVELRKAEKRWVRPSEAEAALAQVEKDTQELFRKFVGILNKLTPQKFETLAEQALQMPIDSEDRLKGCIDRIFIKALEEPNFSVAYAQLCRVLSKVSVEVGTGPDVKKKTFRSLLLTKCQQEFEKDKESDKVIAKLRKKVEEAAPEEKKQLEEELNEKEYRQRHNYLGNIKFIGELFKIKMLSEGIMHECIRRLLQSTTDEEALECFSKLMFTIGKDLDHEKGQALIKQYMDRVELIINAGKISSRIKFFLQDVVELRNANWVPRRENNNPKKIDQIHQEAKQEEAEKMRELAAHPPMPMGSRQISKGSLDMDRKKNIKDGGSKMGSDWSGGGDKDKKLPSSLPKLEASKFRNLGKQPGAQLSLAPAKLSMRPGGGSTATVDKSSRQESKSKPSRSSGSKRSDNRSGGMSASGSGAMIGSGQSRRSSFAPDKHRERQKALELVSNMSGISRSSGSSSSSSKGAESKPVSVLKRPPPDVLSEEEVEKKSSSLIAEFCQNVDYEAAIEEVKDMKSPGKHHRIVYQIVNDVLEKPSVARSNTGKLFHQLIRRNVISKDKFTEGFTEVLEIAEDVEIDVPRIWLYLAEVVVPVIEDGTVSLDILTKAPASIMESGKGAQLLAEVLKLSEKIMGSGKATVLWTNSTVSYSTFKILNVEEFKKRHELQFLPSSIVAHGVDIRRLMELLRSRDNSNTEIMNCIERDCPESRERSLIFIRDLGMALFKTVIDGSGSNAKYNEELLESRITIMTKYIEPQNDSNHQRQLEFLYALQMVLHELEQPAGVANAICRKLSETGVFEDAAFHLWKTTGSETVGHGTTMLALKDFYDWLESTPVESDYSQ